MKKFILVLTVVLVMFSFLSADVYVKQQIKTAMKGQPERTSFTEAWLAKNKMASKTEGATFIINMDSKKMYWIMPMTKSYVEMDLPLDMAKLISPQMAQMMKGMMKSMTVSVTPNGQTKKILNCDCKGYTFLMKMMGMETKMIFWASANVPFDWKSYYPMYKELTKTMSANYGEAYYKEFLKIEGFTMGMEMTSMGMNMTTTTVQIDPKATAPASVFTVPAGYTKKTSMF
jgi:hypothetical protein